MDLGSEAMRGLASTGDAGTPEEWAMEAWGKELENDGRLHIGDPYNLAPDGAASEKPNVDIGEILGGHIKEMADDAKALGFLVTPLGDIVGEIAQRAESAKEEIAGKGTVAANGGAPTDIPTAMDDGDAESGLLEIGEFPDESGEMPVLDEGGFDNKMDGDWEAAWERDDV